MGIEIIKEKLGKKDFLLNRLVEDIEILQEFFDTFIITDARLVHEFEYLKEKFPDVVAIKLVRKNYRDMLNDSERNHITEKDIDNYKDFDYVVENKTRLGLKETARKIVSEENGVI